eukprot:1745867-Heterocapsa_arctica.AAC.1
MLLASGRGTSVATPKARPPVAPRRAMMFSSRIFTSFREKPMNSPLHPFRVAAAADLPASWA